MATATAPRQTPDGIQLQPFERIPGTARWDAGKSYLVTAPHAECKCVDADGTKVNHDVSGTIAHQRFSFGQARVLALDESAESTAIEQRLADLDWLRNNNYRIQLLRVIEEVVETEAI